MKCRNVLTAVVALLVFGSGLASAGFQVFIKVDENGNGNLRNTAGANVPLPFSVAPDPGPGGLPAVLTYDMLNPPGLVSGDVFLAAAEGTFDVIRFNAGETFPATGDTGALLFYSDNVDGFDSMGDTPSPPGAFYPNTLTISEMGSETNNGAVYTPVLGQPGFVAGAAGPVTYTFVSDGTFPVPEPASIALFALGAVGVAGCAYRQRLKVVS